MSTQVAMLPCISVFSLFFKDKEQSILLRTEKCGYYPKVSREVENADSRTEAGTFLLHMFIYLLRFFVWILCKTSAYMCANPLP